MRGKFADQGGLFSYIAPDKRVPANHPLRKIRELVRDVLGELNLSLGKLYASEGRPSIPPEQLLSALLLQVFYGIRSERQLMEQLDYNLLYRWFVGLSPDAPVWDPTSFTKNRDRLQNGDVFTKFMTKLLNHPQVKPLLSDEHFSVDGTLIEARGKRTEPGPAGGKPRASAAGLRSGMWRRPGPAGQQKAATSRVCPTNPPTARGTGRPPTPTSRSKRRSPCAPTGPRPDWPASGESRRRMPIRPRAFAISGSVSRDLIRIHAAMNFVVQSSRSSPTTIAHHRSDTPWSS